jgi:hypothetical protein
MILTKKYKKMKTAAHEKVTVLPTDKTAGYTCIYDNKIYTLLADGTWSIDTDFSYGSNLSLVGLNGNQNQVATYLNALTYTSKRSPFFMTGNLNNVSQAVFSGEDLYVIRRKANLSKSDVILFKSNGDTVKSSEMSKNWVKAVVDSHGNLWIATADDGLYKIMQGESDITPAHYCAADGNLPFDTITDMYADGNELWIVYASATDFKIAHYDGYEWTDLTTDIEADISDIDCDGLTAVHFSGIYSDDDIVIFALDDASISQRMVYYDKTTELFYSKALPVKYTAHYIVNFMKYGDNIFMLVNAAAAQAEGTLVVWNFETGAIVYQGAVDLADLVTNNDKLILWTNDTIQTLTLPATTPADDNTTETAIAAELTSPATLALTGVAISSSGREIYLNAYSDNGNIINNIIEGTPEAQWVVTAR